MLHYQRSVFPLNFCALHRSCTLILCSSQKGQLLLLCKMLKISITIWLNAHFWRSVFSFKTALIEIQIVNLSIWRTGWLFDYVLIATDQSYTYNSCSLNYIRLAIWYCAHCRKSALDFGIMLIVEESHIKLLSAFLHTYNFDAIIFPCCSTSALMSIKCTLPTWSSAMSANSSVQPIMSNVSTVELVRVILKRRAFYTV